MGITPKIMDRLKEINSSLSNLMRIDKITHPRSGCPGRVLGKPEIYPDVLGQFPGDGRTSRHTFFNINQ